MTTYSGFGHCQKEGWRGDLITVTFMQESRVENNSAGHLRAWALESNRLILNLLIAIILCDIA